MHFQSQWPGQALHFPRRAIDDLRAQRVGEVIPPPFSGVNLEGVQPVGNRTEQQPLVAQQSRHLPDAESPRIRIDDVLEHRGALAEIEPGVGKGERLARHNAVKLATIGNAVELRALPRNPHFGRVYIGTDANEVGADQRECNDGASGTASEIEHAAHIGVKITPQTRQQVVQMMIDEAEAVARQNGRQQLFKAPRRSFAHRFDEVRIAGTLGNGTGSFPRACKRRCKGVVHS